VFSVFQTDSHARSHCSDRPDTVFAYGNFANAIRGDGRLVVHRSEERHAAWMRGKHDDLT